MRKYVLLIVLALSMIILDQASKFWVVAELTGAPAGKTHCQASFKRFWSCPHPRPVKRSSIIGKTLQFIYVQNPGAAWGILQNTSAKWRVPLFLLIGVLASVFISFYYSRTPVDNRLLRSALGLVLGGALGNFIDRARLTYVIDFIRMDFGFWPFHPWPTYNIADVAIFIGVVMILLDGFFIHPPKKEETKGGKGPKSTPRNAQ